MKLFKLSVAGLAIVAMAACDEVILDDTADDTGGVVVADCPRDFNDDGVDDVYGVPYFGDIDRTNLTASGAAADATTCGHTGLVLFNMFQTGVDNGWDEEHIVPSVGHTEGDATNPPTDHVQLAVGHVVELVDQVPDQTTLFDTDDIDTITFVLRAYDDASQLTDCAIYGEDPEGVKAGNVPSANSEAPTAMAEINATNCLTW